MRLSVSNIAWPAELDDEVLPWLSSHGIGALEVAPSRVWPNWEGIRTESTREFRRRIESVGIVISSLQAVLFQKPDLHLFRSVESRQAMSGHLRRCADLAVELGATRVVFGAPKNRIRGELPENVAFDIAARFFTEVAEAYRVRGVCLGFEANPSDYHCDFAIDSTTASRLVRAVASPGFGLHLDTACLQLAREKTGVSIEQNVDILCHFHASEPGLGGFSAPVAAHTEAAQALELAGYTGWVALEMRAGDQPMRELQSAVEFLQRTYCHG